MINVFEFARILRSNKNINNIDFYIFFRSMSPHLIYHYPIWHFIGSKHSIWPWIQSNLDHVNYNVVLDMFGGSGVASHGFRLLKKKVIYNDFMIFLQIINSGLLTSDPHNDYLSLKDIEKKIKNLNDLQSKGFIETNYADLYFFRSEAKILDSLISWISNSEFSKNKKNLLFLAFVQAALKKRPFHTFYGTYLQLRNKERRIKQSWDIPIIETFLDFIKKLNEYLDSISKKNLISVEITGFNATETKPEQFSFPIDLLYIDPPFISNKKKQSLRFTDYLRNYHVLEAIANYTFKSGYNIIDPSNASKSIIQGYQAQVEMKRWTDRNYWIKSLEKVVNNYQDKIIVISYRNDSYISKEDIKSLLLCYKNKVILKEREHVYNTPNKPSKFKDLLFIAK